MLILEVRDGDLLYVDHPNHGARDMVYFLGGPFELGFWVKDFSPDGGLMGYVGEDSFERGPAHVIVRGAAGPSVVYGNLLIVGVDAAGRHRDLTGEERDLLVLHPGDGAQLPALEIRRAPPGAWVSSLVD